MSLYERVDRDETSKPRERVEFLLVYTVCFAVMLIPAAIRRLAASASGEAASLQSIFGETRAMAANCAAAAFMGM
jgi:hypothetical protein